MAPFHLISLSQVILIHFLSLCPPASTPLTGIKTRKKKTTKQKNFILMVAVGLVVCLQGTKALAVSLVTNTSIRRVNLRDNWMGGMGGAAVAKMLKGNRYITGSCCGHSMHTFCVFHGVAITFHTSYMINTC